MKKQIRNVSRFLVVLVLVASAVSFFVGCPQANVSDESGGISITGSNGSKMYVTDLDNSTRSCRIKILSDNYMGGTNTQTFTATFNSDFKKVQIADMVVNGSSMPSGTSLNVSDAGILTISYESFDMSTVIDRLR